MSKERKIILFGPWAPPYGGVARHMEDLYENLKFLNFQVKVLGYGDFAPTHDIGKVYFSMHKWPWTLFKIFRHTSPGDVIHNHSVLTTYPNRYFLQTFLWMLKVKRLKWVETIHDPSLIFRFDRFPKPIKKLFSTALVKTDKIIVTHKEIKSFLNTISLPKEKIEVISPLLPRIIEVSKLSKYPHLSNFFGLHYPVIVTIGTFHPWYDFKTIIQAFIKLKKEYGKAGLIIIHSKFACNAEYERNVKQLIEGLQSDILVISDIKDEVLMGILKKCSLMIRGSLDGESFGLCRIESILMGTPVVATKAGETRYMVVYEHGNPDDLYKKIKAVLGGEIKIDMDEAQAFFKRMADENLKRITDIYRNIWIA